MTVRKIDHIGITVANLDATIDFFQTCGLTLLGTGEVEGDWVGRIIGLDNVHSKIAMLGTPEGTANIELSEFITPPVEANPGYTPVNVPGLRHFSFLVNDIETLIGQIEAKGYSLVGKLEQYENAYKLCYVRGPENIIVELAEELG